MAGPIAARTEPAVAARATARPISADLLRTNGSRSRWQGGTFDGAIGPEVCFRDASTLDAVGVVVLVLVGAFWIAVAVLAQRGRHIPDDPRPLGVQLRGQNRREQARLVIRWATGL